MTRRLLVLGALALVPLGVQPSQATFVASSTTAASTFATAADFNTVAVALDDPGTPLQGSVALAATASSDRGIERVRFQVSPAGAGTWADACEATAAPYTCAWDTNGDDGLVDVRAVARDTAGYERSATRTARRVDNTAPSVSLADPGASLKGSVTLERDRIGRRHRPGGEQRDRRVPAVRRRRVDRDLPPLGHAARAPGRPPAARSPTATTTCAPAPRTRSATPPSRRPSPAGTSTTASPPRPSRARRRPSPTAR